MSDDLPDAPWAKSDTVSDLPDAPWATPSQQAPQASSTAADVAKSAGIGAAKGAIDFAGLPGDLSNLLAKGSKAAGDYIGGLFGAAPSPDIAGPVLPTSGGLQRAIESQTGEFYQPKTTPGRYAGTIGEFLGNPLTYTGPGGLASKALSGAAAGAGSEGLGQLAQTYAPELEPAARVVGAVLPGTVTGMAARAIGTPSRVPAPATEDLFDAADAHYQALHGYGVELEPHAVANTAANITSDLTNAGYRDYLAPKTFRAVDELRDLLPMNATTQDIEAVRRALGKAGGDPAERDAARRAIGHIDDMMANLQPSDVAVNPQFAPYVAAEGAAARANYAAAKQSELIEDTITAAERQAASTGSGGNLNNALRQRFRSILQSPAKRRGLNQDELDAMDELVRGTTAANAARLAGKAAPSGVVSGAGSLMLGHAIGHTYAVPAAGYLFKKAADAATMRQAQRILEMRQLRSPLATQMGSSPLPPRLPMLPRAATSLARFGIPAMEQ